jgi:dethiobiotin synthetase
LINCLAIVGTDTDTGKTVLTTSLAAYWQKYRPRQSLGLLKLMQTGMGDGELYRQLFAGDPQIEIVVPLSFATPIAPPLAADKEGKLIDLGLVWRSYQALNNQQDWTIVETLGGLGSPVTHELTVADLLGDWRLPAVLVVPVRLGGISQAVTSVALARQARVDLRGIVLNCSRSDSEAKLDDWTPVDLIESFTNLPVLGILPYLRDSTNLDTLAEVASNLDLERFLAAPASVSI